MPLYLILFERFWSILVKKSVVAMSLSSVIKESEALKYFGNYFLVLCLDNISFIVFQVFLCQI